MAKSECCLCSGTLDIKRRSRNAKDMSRRQAELDILDKLGATKLHVVAYQKVGKGKDEKHLFWVIDPKESRKKKRRKKRTPTVKTKATRRKARASKAPARTRRRATRKK